ETAFAALVRRHGPLVLGVCRRVLGNHHDAEDAFQATFLVLARKAEAIARQSSLASWLYRVAYRTAVKARALGSSRKAREARAAVQPTADLLDDISGRELLAVLDEELHRLPERYRAPLVLCYLQGLTRDEAAQQLGWSLGTLKRRLDEGRDRLRRRLERRGVTVSAPLLLAGLSESATGAVLPPRLADGTVQAALDGATAVVSLAQGTVGMRPLRWLAGLVLAVGLLGFGVAAVVAPRHEQPADPQPAAQKPANEKAIMTIRGQVRDAAGKPVPRAHLAVLALPNKWRPSQGESDLRLDLLHDGRTDDQGRFEVRVPRPMGTEEYPPILAASVPGHGLGLELLAPDADKADLAVKLPPEQVLRGRLIDLQGQPIANVSIRFMGLTEKRDVMPVGIIEPVKRVAWWPGPLQTDAEGRFRVHGAGPNQEVMLEIRDDRFDTGMLKLWTNDRQRREEVTHALAPAAMVTGRITYADTGKVAVGAQVQSEWRKVPVDREGRYRLNPFTDRSPRGALYAHPPEGQPYLGVIKEIQKPRGGVPQQPLDIKLPRGVLVRGKVTEAPSGKPVEGAAVYYLPQRADNPNYMDALTIGPVFRVLSNRDGSYRLPVLPGPGWLLVMGPAPEYLLERTSMREMMDRERGGRPHYFHARKRYEFKPGSGPQEMDLTLRRAPSVTLKLTGPKGEAVTSVEMVSRPTSTLAQLAGFEEVRGQTVRGDEIRVHPGDAQSPFPVVFFDEATGWGAVVAVSGKQAGQTLTVRLEPCGKATARFVDAEGKPLAGLWPEVELVFAPGAGRYDGKAFERGEFAADAVHVGNVYHKHYRFEQARTDDQGRVTLPMLVPGATYRINSTQFGGRVLREFTVRSGETLDLKDIRVAPEKN
ncbi:MAG: sigma-70 family RNA polymerase sigma factor, partial [Gemmataceae bacterium]|nr:sigma-70 family RNA polymerase sigma factor [Gemmataceae bacterium]